jgi:hypothetical protein
MTRHLRIAFALALAMPAAGAFGQQSPTGRARDTKRVVEEGEARVKKAADEQVEQGDESSKRAGQKEVPPPEDLGSGPLEGGARAADEARGNLPPPDTYTIRPGDTLWDLSGRFLNNPWYWPKVWSYNPEISNPHWIYPGNVLRFYASDEEGPVRVEPVEPGAEPVAEEGDYEAPRELEDFSRADMKAPSSEEERDVVAVAGPYKIGYVAPRTTLIRHDAFVTPRELAESGRLRGAFEEKLMLTSLDRVYADFETQAPVKAGETYVVYKTVRPITHPVTGELFGYQTEVLGTGRVVVVSEKAVTLIIQQSFDVIERGALLGPWTQKALRRVERRPNAVALDGRIIAGQVPVLTQFGENQVVFVDRGSSDGVQEGNVFHVLRSGDMYGRQMYETRWDSAFPPETMAELLIVDVKERASAALVLRSLRELMIGDHVEMRVGSGSGGN